jgi:hypothetical protein
MTPILDIWLTFYSVVLGCFLEKGLNFELVSDPAQSSLFDNHTYLTQSTASRYQLILVLNLTKGPLSTAIIIGFTPDSQGKLEAKQNAGLLTLCEFTVAHQLRWLSSCQRAMTPLAESCEVRIESELISSKKR